MIKAVIFDFDGVLVESAHIKTEAFRKLFSEWPDKVDEIVSYHLRNMGISRHVKFRYFYENILKERYHDDIGEKLGIQFTGIVLDEIKRARSVDGVKSFLEQNRLKYLFFIASGTPQEELDDIVSFRGIGNYFQGIFGTPAAKVEIIENILKSYSLDTSQVVFVGDAESDRIAANNTGVYFIARMTDEGQSFAGEKWKIKDMTELMPVIGMIEGIDPGKKSR